MNTLKTWKVWIDTGGTFTDCIAQDPNGQFLRRKVLSSGNLRGRITRIIDHRTLRVEQHWKLDRDLIQGYSFQLSGSNHSPCTVKEFNLNQSIITLSDSIPELNLSEFELNAHEEAPILAMRLITRCKLEDALPPMEVRLGSTKGTNALLEHKGEAPLLITTRGFADMCQIGDQQRDNLFALNIQQTPPLYRQVIEVDERIDSRGNLVEPLTESKINRVLREVYRSDHRVIVIAFLNSYTNPVHEKNLYNILKTAGYKYVSASHQLEQSIHFLARTETALVNAYLMPIIESYLQKIRAKLHPDTTLKIMTSAGGLVDYRQFQPKDSLLSGPAGGVSGAAQISQKLQLPKLIAFDMGGTSTDVSRYSEKFDYVYQTRVGHYRIMSPSIPIETVAAGGGSVCSFDGYKLNVGPHSAGASPGPACYGGNGPLTVTDINLLLGRLEPSCFGIPLNREYANNRLHELKANEPALKEVSEEVLLQGFFDIATEKMAKAMEKISIRKGYAPSEHALLAFGGAGGMHACAIAHQLGIQHIVVPYDAGILSAYGIGRSRLERIINRQILRKLEETLPALPLLLEEMESEVRHLLITDGLSADQIRVENVVLNLRFTGQNETLEVVYTPDKQPEETFKKAYTGLFGHYIYNRAIEVESIRLLAGGGDYPEPPIAFPSQYYAPNAYTYQKSLHRGKWLDTPVYRIDELDEGARIQGPALILNDTSTTCVDPGWQALVNQTRDLLLQTGENLNQTTPHRPPEQVQLELFTNRFRSVVEDMGSLLARTAFSVNIKERLDFSCALLDADGYLVANAPHIPVHLGALGLCTREVTKKFNLLEGDILVTNHPAYGGSHLPDVTLIAPVYVDGQRIGYVANRAHHAEIGGITPGSMPAHATCLEQEGVVIPPCLIFRKGESQLDSVVSKLENAKYPTRSIAENVADLKAAIASIRTGQEQLALLCSQFGATQVVQYMQKLKAHAAHALSGKLLSLVHHNLHATEQFDDGNSLCVTIRPGQKVVIDFEGTSAQHPGNMNATPAIVYSAVLYTLRLLIDEDIPLNEGFLIPVDIQIPPSLLNPDFSADPAQSPAVVGGNVEVSQRLVDTLLKAFGVAACSQGTMNNLIFGNPTFGFYETLCGGVGATAIHHGASAVHQHMTNTRITDPEIMELRYPVRVEKFAIRKGSGGKGQFHGGDGVERQIRFLEAVNLTLLSQHRKEAPYGLNGGLPGQCGKQFRIDKLQQLHELDGNISLTLEAGEAILIQTPGGGAYGSQ